MIEELALAISVVVGAFEIIKFLSDDSKRRFDRLEKEMSDLDDQVNDIDKNTGQQQERLKALSDLLDRVEDAINRK